MTSVVADALNPYRQWLELDTDASSLNHYELLGLPLYENDADKILHAADRALARVRSHRPGTHAAAWSKLLDELAQAKKCLRDAKQKNRYDAALRAQQHTPSADDHKTTKGTNTGAPEIAAVNQMPDLFPPGMEPTEQPKQTAPTRKPSTGAAAPKPKPTQIDRPARKTKPAPSETAAQKSHRTPTPVKKRPPPPPTSTVPRAGRLLDDPYEEDTPSGAMLSESVPDVPVNAHVAPPRTEKSSILPIAVSVAAVILVVTTVVMFLAMGGTFGDSPSSTSPASTSPTPNRTPTKRPQPATDVTPQLNPALPKKPNNTPLTTPAKTNTSKTNALPPTAPPPGTGEIDKREQQASSTPTVTESPTKPASQTPQVKTPAATVTDAAPSATMPASGTASKTKDEPTTPRVPTRQELAQLGRALAAAKGALGTHNFDLASIELTNAAKLAVSPDHQAMVARLQRLADLEQSFWQTVTATVKRFQGAEELTIGSGGLVVLVVETGPDSITIRKAGRNQRYSITQMPPGLALAIAKTQLAPNAPDTLLQFGACLATLADTKPVYLQEARKYWQQAKAAGADNVDDLLLTLTDSHDLGK